MEKVTSLFKASWEEVTQHITWPPFKELQSSSWLVLIASLIFALVVGLMDAGFQNVLNAFYSLSK
ncbi:preprotein translocase subunit SecE [Siphonobacter aquaeclarae]|uniref:Preprotein translocase subunit SecE n=1 Tax=Siphonobacter aquaeclarae TaxID=563176 RepID=A0A1G9VKU5_9BACT|nr:preprotein translocase subunit SecE [Siphonobacter aquaeclarae]MBO9639570.1 preprotein translocase subunit SecE [Siphonobacter aquaeclarae]SDM72661.1 preprotein translocase subunit SecE [Siphonobacter aquaeclarae]